MQAAAYLGAHPVSEVRVARVLVVRRIEHEMRLQNDRAERRRRAQRHSSQRRTKSAAEGEEAPSQRSTKKAATRKMAEDAMGRRVPSVAKKPYKARE